MASDVERCQGPSRIVPGRKCLNALPCKTHGEEAREAQPKVEGRMDDVSMVTTIRLLADVRLNLAYGHSPEEAESDEHKAVRLIEDECVRARASEAALSERVARAERDYGAIHALLLRCREAFARGLWSHGRDGACRQCDPDAPDASTFVCAFHALWDGVAP